MLENYLVDKENNANLINATTRRHKYLLNTQARPVTPVLQTTFNPLPKINKCSIPIVPAKSRQPRMQTIDSQCTTIHNCNQPIKTSNRQGPKIAKNSKLKGFFGIQSCRYNQNSVNLPHNFRGESLDMIPCRRQQRTITPLFSDRQNTKNWKRRQQFQKLYMRQKQEFQRLLKKYGIQQSVEDEEYLNFILNQS